MNIFNTSDNLFQLPWSKNRLKDVSFLSVAAFCLAISFAMNTSITHDSTSVRDEIISCGKFSGKENGLSDRLPSNDRNSCPHPSSTHLVFFDSKLNRARLHKTGSC